MPGKGVSYCATCDGAFFRGKVTAVVGGGNVAAEDAAFLARGCEKVYLIHRRNELRAAGSLQEKLFALPNVEMVWDSQAVRIEGEEMTQRLIVKDVHTEAERTLPVDGVFAAIGITPNSALYEGLVELDAQGYIVADETWPDQCAGGVCGRGYPHESIPADYYGCSGRRQCGAQRGSLSQ